MDQKECSPIDVDDYIAHQAPQVQEILQRIRTTIKTVVPDACEEINNDIPAIRLAEHLLIFYAADEKIPGYNLSPLEISDIDVAPLIKDSLNDPAAYPYDQPIAYDFIRRLM